MDKERRLFGEDLKIFILLGDPKEVAEYFNETAIREILNQGHLKCRHEYVDYLDNDFDGQAWWCDICSRHERLDYSPAQKIRFPPNAYIRCPNPDFGDNDTYAHKANDEGVSMGVLPEKDRPHKSDLEAKFAEKRQELGIEKK